MRARQGRHLEAIVEAAFDRYNRAILSDLEPTVGLFIESLEAEGLRLLPERRQGPSHDHGLAPDVEDRRRPVAAGRSAGLISRQVRGLS